MFILGIEPKTTFDLHVLSITLAFLLSQDQTQMSDYDWALIAPMVAPGEPGLPSVLPVLERPIGRNWTSRPVY